LAAEAQSPPVTLPNQQNAVDPTSLAAAQSTADQIQSVAQQVTQVTQDPTIPVEDKAHTVPMLADQFNGLVVQWQQQVANMTAASSGEQSPLPDPSPPALNASQSDLTATQDQLFSGYRRGPADDHRFSGPHLVAHR
jgi:hypothetical protein